MPTRERATSQSTPTPRGARRYHLKTETLDFSNLKARQGGRCEGKEKMLGGRAVKGEGERPRKGQKGEKGVKARTLGAD